MQQHKRTYEAQFCKDCGFVTETKPGNVYGIETEHDGFDSLDCDLVSKCCEEEVEDGFEDDDGNRVNKDGSPYPSPDSTEKCGTMVNEPTLMDNLKSILIANSKALLNEGER